MGFAGDRLAFRKRVGLGGAIGAGLFIGSGAGIQAADPAVLIFYLVATIGSSW